MSVFGEVRFALRWLLAVLLTILIVANGYFIIAARLHYTVDLVAAALVTFLGWHGLGSWLGIRDVHPFELMAAKNRCTQLAQVSFIGSEREIDGLPPHCHIDELSQAAPIEEADLDRMWRAQLMRQPRWKAPAGIAISTALCVLGPVYALSVSAPLMRMRGVS